MKAEAETKAGNTMSVCGIDAGSFKTLSYVAWLKQKKFKLDVYLPSIQSPLPEPPGDIGLPSHIGIDLIQGLPTSGKRRLADQKADTPTRRLPSNREGFNDNIAFGAFIACGIDLFWSVYEKKLAAIAGLPMQSDSILFETYPRLVIKKLWPTLSLIPSKRQKPFNYIEEIWSRIKDLGYTCSSIERPTVDQVDAMLCAIVADRFRESGARVDRVGADPVIDDSERIIREGYIYYPI